MRRLIWCAAATAGVLPAIADAQDVRVTPLVEARFRWEHVDQAGLPRDADAVTARVRAGVAASSGPWQALVEAEGVFAPLERYDSGTNGRPRYPLVVDPQNIELNRAQLRYADGHLTATAGRQRLELADQRFVGSASFRQSEQTFDAVRAVWGKPTSVFVDATYVWSVRTVNGIDGRGARQQAVSGDNLFVLAGARTPAGTLSVRSDTATNEP